MVNALDTQLFYLINKNCANPMFDKIMPLITNLGGGEIIFLTALALMLARNGKWRKAGLALMAGITVAYYATDFLKYFFARPRPFTVLPDVHKLVSASQFSFPSGHAAQAFMAASVLAGFFKKYIIFFTLAALIGFSRVYCGVHFVSDVMGGAVLGIAIGYAIVKITEKIQI